MALWQQTWFPELAVLMLGAFALLMARSQRIKRTAAEQLMNEEQLRQSEAERRRYNWSTVPMMAFAIASLVMMIDEKSGIKTFHVFYGALFLAAYAWFVYKWNRVDP